MPTKRPGWQGRIAKIRKENFVGRTEYLRQFVENFADEGPAYLLFFVNGEGGVGKSTLLKQYATLATSPSVKALVIGCDDELLSPAAVMGHIAQQLAEHGLEHKEFDERYKTFRARREEIESDTKAPRGALDLVVRGMTGLAIKSARRAPGVGVFADYVDEADAGEALTQGLNYIIDRFGNRDEVQLLRDPESTLSPLFVDLLNKACEKQRLALLFDVFERTGAALEPWLLQLVNFEYGDLDERLTLVISGRDPLSQQWTSFASAICHITLEPFTPDETRQYLSNRDITDEALVQQIHADTGGLPVLVELLAGTHPHPGLPLPDISPDAVKRFLQWIPDESQRQVALFAAVPRQINRDILGAVLGAESARQFTWLTAQSYMRTSTTRGWFYHEKVRELMLRFLRHTQPSDLTAAHQRLTAFFETQQTQLTLSDKAAYESDQWRNLEVERVYHDLCHHPARHTTTVNAFLHAFRWRWRFAENLAQVCQQAGQEIASPDAQDVAHLLIEFYKSYDKNEYENSISYSTVFAQRNDLDVVAQVVLYARRGDTYRQLAQYPKALADFDRALALDDKYNVALDLRGETYRQLAKYSEALADFDRALALNEKNTWALAHRGETYRQLAKYPKALSDFDRALALNDKDTWALALRGETYRQLAKYPKALADFDRALALDDKDTWALALRGLTYRLMKKYSEALADFDRAIALDDKDSWTLAQRGLTYRLMEKYPEALADFDRVIALNDKYTWAFAQRGLTYRLMEKYPEALADFDRAITLNDKLTWALALRGETYRLMEEYPEALADFDRAIALDDRSAETLALRGKTYRLMEKYPEALADFDRAIALDDKSVETLTLRGKTYRLMEKYPEALADFDRAITLNDKYTWALALRGDTYRQLAQYPKALADFDRALALDDKYTWALALRGKTYRLMEKYPEALADFDRAIALDDKYTWALAQRGLTYQSMEKYPEALADFDHAIALDDKSAETLALRGKTYRLMEKYPEALADFNRAIALDDKLTWAIVRRGEAYRLTGKYAEALADLNQVVELDPKEDWWRYSRGLVYQSTGQFDLARADFASAQSLALEAYTQDVTNWTNALNLAVYYLALGRHPEAEALYQSAVATPAPSAVLRDALNDLRNFLPVFPDNITAIAMQTLLRVALEKPST